MRKRAIQDMYFSPGYSDFSKVGRRKTDILNDNISGIWGGATLHHN